MRPMRPLHCNSLWSASLYTAASAARRKYSEDSSKRSCELITLIAGTCKGSSQSSNHAAPVVTGDTSSRADVVSAATLQQELIFQNKSKRCGDVAGIFLLCKSTIGLTWSHCTVSCCGAYLACVILCPNRFSLPSCNQTWPSEIPLHTKFSWENHLEIVDYHGWSPSLMSFDYQGALSIPPSTCRRLQKRAPDEEPGRTPGCQRESAEQHRGCWMSGLTKWTFKEHPHFFGVVFSYHWQIHGFPSQDMSKRWTLGMNWW